MTIFIREAPIEEIPQVFMHSLNSTCAKIKILTINIVCMKLRPLIGRRIIIGRQLHVNQPLDLRAAFSRMLA